MKKLLADIRKHKAVYIMLIPVVAYYILFHYKPMYGIIIAFMDYRPAIGIGNSAWVGLTHFESFIHGAYIVRLIRNTLTLSIGSLIWGFPAPIILALLLNEMEFPRTKKVIQSITYIPHFISTVVACGLIIQFCASDGLFNYFVELFGGVRSPLLGKEDLFAPIYIISGIWKQVGWGSIIYLAAISGISPELYEAARIDGAGRLRQAWHITIQGIVPTIVTMLILRMGSIMNIGHEKILLLQNSLNMEKSDVISTYVYRRGLEDGSFSFSTAVGLFNSIVNILLVVSTNAISRKLTESSLW